MKNTFCTLCIAGTHSGVGKTTVTLGLLAALRGRGMAIQPFKCGPDYIDAGHHRRACGKTSHNLDTWMMGTQGVKQCYARAVRDADAGIVEGVMGLFDGASAVSPEGSTAHVAELLGITVVLVVNAKAMARSIAALVHGYATFMPSVKIGGVVANNVSSNKHADILREALASSGLPPLVGVLPCRKEWSLPERHLGLIAETESGTTEKWFDSLAEGMERHVNIDRLMEIGETERPCAVKTGYDTYTPKVRLGLARDKAFHFYYEDNLSLLRQFGAEPVIFSPLRDKALPDDLDGLYIGGGFPELFAERLFANASMRESIHTFANTGGHIYAECGGLMYLCRRLIDQSDRIWEMCGVLDADTKMEPGGRRLGYVEAETLNPGPFGPAGTVVRGHEFHWSSIVDRNHGLTPIYNVRNAAGSPCGIAGLQTKNVWASYVHVHFSSNPKTCKSWVEQLHKNSNQK